MSRSAIVTRRKEIPKCECLYKKPPKNKQEVVVTKENVVDGVEIASIDRSRTRVRSTLAHRQGCCNGVGSQGTGCRFESRSR